MFVAIRAFDRSWTLLLVCPLSFDATAGGAESEHHTVDRSVIAPFDYGPTNITGARTFVAHNISWLISYLIKHPHLRVDHGEESPLVNHQSSSQAYERSWRDATERGLYGEWCAERCWVGCESKQGAYKEDCRADLDEDWQCYDFGWNLTGRSFWYIYGDFWLHHWTYFRGSALWIKYIRRHIMGISGWRLCSVVVLKG